MEMKLQTWIWWKLSYGLEFDGNEAADLNLMEMKLQAWIWWKWSCRQELMEMKLQAWIWQKSQILIWWNWSCRLEFDRNEATDKNFTEKKLQTWIWWKWSCRQEFDGNEAAGLNLMEMKLQAWFYVIFLHLPPLSQSDHSIAKRSGKAHYHTERPKVIPGTSQEPPWHLSYKGLELLIQALACGR